MIVGSYGSSSLNSAGSYREGGIRISKIPFMGCYDRSYYDKRGRLHPCYVSDSSYGTKNGWSGINIFGTVVITVIWILIFVSGLPMSIFSIGGKVSGDTGRIFIEDKWDILTESEEKKILEIFSDVYEKSGMPVTLYIEDYSWEKNYDSLEEYARTLYYRIGYDEDAMLIVCTTEGKGDSYDWGHNVYFGEDTGRCLSSAAREKFRLNLIRAMSGQDLVEALDYSWSSVMDDLTKTTVHIEPIIIMLILAVSLGAIYAAIFVSVRNGNEIYRYFKENPDKLSNIPMTLSVYRKCPNCGASNKTGKEVCPYCGALLKMSNADELFVVE